MADANERALHELNEVTTRRRGELQALFDAAAAERDVKAKDLAAAQSLLRDRELASQKTEDEAREAAKKLEGELAAAKAKLEAGEKAFKEGHHQPSNDFR